MSHRRSAVAAAHREPQRRHNYAQQRQSSRSNVPDKRELTATQLILFKLFGCFSAPDDLPPPDLNKPIYQASKSATSTTISAPYRSSPDSSDFSRKRSISSTNTASTVTQTSRHNAPHAATKQQFPRVMPLDTPVAHFALPTVQSQNNLRQTPPTKRAQQHVNTSPISVLQTNSTRPISALSPSASNHHQILQSIPPPSSNITPHHEASSSVSRLTSMFEQ
ncbi:unnamed protein product [Agarophyton chilense]